MVSGTVGGSESTCGIFWGLVLLCAAQTRESKSIQRGNHRAGPWEESEDSGFGGGVDANEEAEKHQTAAGLWCGGKGWLDLGHCGAREGTGGS